MLKCIRIRTCTKKKLKYNLKLLKFRKASQVLRSCQENAIIRGLWVTIGRDMTQDTASHLAGLFISRKRHWQGWPRGGRPAGTHCSTVWSQLSSHYGFINTWP